MRWDNGKQISSSNGVLRFEAKTEVLVKIETKQTVYRKRKVVPIYLPVKGYIQMKCQVEC